MTIEGEVDPKVDKVVLEVFYKDDSKDKEIGKVKSDLANLEVKISTLEKSIESSLPQESLNKKYKEANKELLEATKEENKTAALKKNRFTQCTVQSSV